MLPQQPQFLWRRLCGRREARRPGSFHTYATCWARVFTDPAKLPTSTRQHSKTETGRNGTEQTLNIMKSTCWQNSWFFACYCSWVYQTLCDMWLALPLAARYNVQWCERDHCPATGAEKIMYPRKWEKKSILHWAFIQICKSHSGRQDSKWPWMEKEPKKENMDWRREYRLYRALRQLTKAPVHLIFAYLEGFYLPNVSLQTYCTKGRWGGG